MISIVALYIVSPAIIAVVVRYKNSRGHKGVGVFRFLFLCLSRGDITDRFPVLIFVLLYLLFVSQSYVLDGGPGGWLLKAFGMMLLLLLCCVSLFLASVVYNFSDFRKNNSFLVGVLGTASVSVTVALSAVWADGYISDATTVSGTEFATGMAWLGIVLSPLSWTFGLSIFALIIYAYALTRLTFTDNQDNAYTGVGLTVSRKPKKRKKRFSSLVHSSCVVGLAITAVAPLQLIGYLLSNDHSVRFLNGALFFSSFHIKAEVCGKEYLMGKVKLLDDDVAVLGVPNENQGYIFSRINCKR
ncbi:MULTISPECIES: hypothetical protein [Pseudomonas]|uniref:hypothetical protein n=1 Tax=Pseudomonas TaxID=286 RepID=UPI0012FBDAE7|nr:MULTISPECIES: hypothetical protein [Pseudomonas]MDC7828502.1 hypothetical protein [Pseudomonas benzopyrenica]